MNFDGYKIQIPKGYKDNDNVFDHFVDFLYLLGFKFVAPSVSICVGNNHAKK
jgi:hypothetical protein